MTHQPLSPGFLPSYLSWPPNIVRLTVKLVVLLNDIYCFLVLCFKYSCSCRQSRQGIRSDTTSAPLPCLFSAQHQLPGPHVVMWPQLTMPFFWLMTRDPPDIHACATQSADLKLRGLNLSPMGDGCMWIKALPSVLLWMTLRFWLYSFLNIPVAASLIMHPCIGSPSFPTSLLFSPTFPSSKLRAYIPSTTGSAFWDTQFVTNVKNGRSIS